jgi:hypothetical protein
MVRSDRSPARSRSASGVAGGRRSGRRPTGRPDQLQRLHDAVFSVAPIPTDAAQTVAQPRREPGRDMWLCGGGILFCSLLREGLVDTVEFGVSPLLLGRAGASMLPSLPELSTPVRLELTRHHACRAVSSCWITQYARRRPDNALTLAALGRDQDQRWKGRYHRRARGGHEGRASAFRRRCGGERPRLAIARETGLTIEELNGAALARERRCWANRPRVASPVGKKESAPC